MNYNYIVLDCVTGEQVGGDFTTYTAANLFANKVMKAEPKTKLSVHKVN